MPRGDATGPNGLGPMTGRKLGRCAGYDVSGSAQGFGGRRNLGRGGMGRGYGRGYGYQAASPYRNASYDVVPDEKTVLTAQVKAREDELKALKERITVLEHQTGEENK